LEKKERGLSVKKQVNPMPGQFTGEKAKQKKVVKSKYSDWVGIYDDDWQLHKYSVAQ
jgi:hypothetical protein